MLISIICFVVAFGATLVGSLSGLGGGVIIKPALDVMAASQLTLAEISALSSVTVFSMAALSTCKGIQRGIPLNLNLLLPLALSSGIGGILGNHAFTKAMRQFGESLCRNIQSVTLFLLMAMILILYLADKRCRPLHLTGKKKIAAAGLFLGALSSFLGIGGGPVNVVALKLLFSFNEREQVLDHYLSYYLPREASFSPSFSADFLFPLLPSPFLWQPEESWAAMREAPWLSVFQRRLSVKFLLLRFCW